MIFFKFLFTIYLASFFNSDLKAAVYQSIRSFEEQDELLYSEWVKSAVKKDIFSNPQSPYYGIKTDCADAAFALRTIYAFENKLSVQFFSSEDKIITEKTTRYDHLSSNEITKLKAFIEFIGENIGSEELAGKNTYSISFQSIKSGDLFVAKWTNSKEEISHHVYIVKDVLPTGDLLLFSSTQPRALRPLLPRKGMPLRTFSDKPFGFRRFLPIGEKLDYSLMQYEAIKLGEDHFFKLVKNSLKSIEDTLDANVDRRIENICEALSVRKDVISLALEEKVKLKKQCFNNYQYNEFSTLSRDQNIIQDIERLINGYRTMIKNELPNNLDENKILALNFLVNLDKSDRAKEQLQIQCPLELSLSATQKVKYSIKSFYDRYKKGLISSNPNESNTARWGLGPIQKNCPNL